MIKRLVLILLLLAMAGTSLAGGLIGSVKRDGRLAPGIKVEVYSGNDTCTSTTNDRGIYRCFLKNTGRYHIKISYRDGESDSLMVSNAIPINIYSNTRRLNLHFTVTENDSLKLWRE